MNSDKKTNAPIFISIEIGDKKSRKKPAAARKKTPAKKKHCPAFSFLCPFLLTKFGTIFPLAIITNSIAFAAFSISCTIRLPKEPHADDPISAERHDRLDWV